MTQRGQLKYWPGGDSGPSAKEGGPVGQGCAKELRKWAFSSMAGKRFHAGLGASHRP
jgi:hypothetical protein